MNEREYPRQVNYYYIAASSNKSAEKGGYNEQKFMQAGCLDGLISLQRD